MDEWDGDWYKAAVEASVREDRIGQCLDRLEPLIQKFLDGIQGAGENHEYQDGIITLSKDIFLDFLLGWDSEISESKRTSVREDADYYSYIIHRRSQKTALEHLFF